MRADPPPRVVQQEQLAASEDVSAALKAAGFGLKIRRRLEKALAKQSPAAGAVGPLLGIAKQL